MEAIKKTTHTLTKSFHFDRQEVFDAQILPLLRQVRELCQEHGVALVVGAQYASGEDGDGLSYLTNNQDAQGNVLDATELLLAYNGLHSLISAAAEGDLLALIALAGTEFHSASCLVREQSRKQMEKGPIKVGS